MAILLGVVALAGLRPWATTYVAPDLSVSPGVGVALGDSAVVAEAGSPSSAGTGGIAAPRPAPTVVAPVAVSTPERHAAQPQLAVSAGRALAVAAPSPVATPPAPEPAPSPEPVAATPTPAPEGAPASPPVVASVPSSTPGTSGGPVTSGVGSPEPEQACEGDEYVITILPLTEAGGDEQSFEIVLTRLNEDGSTDELRVEGDLLDAQSLTLQLSSEGNCVQLEAGTAVEAPDPSLGEPATPNSP